MKSFAQPLKPLARYYYKITSSSFCFLVSEKKRIKIKNKCKLLLNILGGVNEVIYLITFSRFCKYLYKLYIDSAIYDSQHTPTIYSINQYYSTSNGASAAAGRDVIVEYKYIRGL